MPLVVDTVLTGGIVPLPTDARAPAGGTVTGEMAFAYPSVEAQVAANTVPFLGAPDAVLAALTEGGRELIARGLVEGLSFRVIGFRVGRGGYDPSNPLNALPLNEADTELQDPFYPGLALPPKAIDRFEPPNISAMSCLCRVPASEALAGLGELGLYVEIIASPSDPTEVGDRYLFAHLHRPMLGKTTEDVWVCRVVTQYSFA